MIRQWDQYDFRNVRRIPVLKRGSGRFRNKIRYLDVVAAYDIETTLIRKYRQSVLYIWQMQINRTTIIGRTWDDFKQFYNRLNESIPDDCVMVVYVHNLSYEFQFLKSIIPIDSVFAMDNRKILKFTSGKLEFRCSYLQTNMSLEKFLKQMNVRDQKIKGFDYSKRRYSWTPLTDSELEYCVHDVKGLRQAMIKRLDQGGDNLYTIPLTSTGYSRLLAKAALKGYQKYIHHMLPDLDVFRALRDEFRGGDTHCHRLNSNVLIRARDGIPIESWDISSSYPAVMLTEKFPRDFHEAEPEYLINYINYGKACLFYITLYDLQLKDPDHGDPYLSKAKCLQLAGAEIDNGRILSAQSARTCLNEIDFSIICSEYQFSSYAVDRLWIASKQYLPQNLRDLIFSTYVDKTRLKGVDEYQYQKAKELFNAYYGMMVQNPCKPEFVFKDGVIETDFSRTEADLIEDYRRKGWLPYQWGVWVTSYARLKLHKGIHCVDPLRFLYCDTDSVKCLGDYSASFAELNKEYLREDLSALDPEGNRHYIGIYEKDDSYLRFKSMGAKKYAYEDLSGNLHITVSGVNKSKGAAELGSIEKFNEGFKFRKAGGTESVYNDFPEIKEIRIQGHKQQITSNIAIIESTYTLGLSVDYKKLLNFLMNTDIRYSLHFER